MNFTNQKGSISALCITLICLFFGISISLFAKSSFFIQGEICSIEGLHSLIKSDITPHVMNEISLTNVEILKSLVDINSQYQKLLKIRFSLSTTAPIKNPESGKDIEEKYTKAVRSAFQKSLNLARSSHMIQAELINKLPLNMRNLLEWAPPSVALCQALQLTPKEFSIRIDPQACTMAFKIPSVVHKVPAPGALWRSALENKSTSNEGISPWENAESSHIGYLRFKPKILIQDFRSGMIRRLRTEVNCGEKFWNFRKILISILGLWHKVHAIPFEGDRILIHPKIDENDFLRKNLANSCDTPDRGLGANTKKYMISQVQWNCFSTSSETVPIGWLQSVFIPKWTTRIENMKGHFKYD